MEIFWGKLEQEWLNGQHFRTRKEAMSATFWYMGIYYRRKRLHASNGYKTSEAYVAAVAANFCRITSYNVCYTKLLRKHRVISMFHKNSWNFSSSQIFK